MLLQVLSWSVLRAAQVLLGWEYDVILSHLDTVWLTDPLPYLQGHVPAAADVVLSSEAPAAAAVMGSRSADLAPHPDPQGPVGTGVAYVRGTQQGQAAVELSSSQAAAATAGPTAAESFASAQRFLQQSLALARLLKPSQHSEVCPLPACMAAAA